MHWKLHPPLSFSEAAIRRVFSPVVTEHGIKVEYGFGWRTTVDEISGFAKLQEPMLWHDGAWLGYENSVNWFPARRLWVIALTNGSGFSEEIDR
jgi:hypothetical protein